MLFDVLSGLDSIKICTGYRLDGELLASPPSTISRLARVEAEYIELPGWKEDITGIRNFDELPDNAKAYVAKIEELTGVPVGIISVGPDREQTIIRSEKLKNF